MDEIEVVVRVGRRAEPGGDLPVADGLVAVAAGAFDAGARLCLGFKGVFFTPSETDARGRAPEPESRDATEPAGDTTFGRVAPFVPAAGLVLVDEDNAGFEAGGAVAVLAGAMDALRAGAAPAALETPEAVFGGGGAMFVFVAGAPEALGVFLRTGAGEVAVAADFAVLDVVGGLDEADFTAPAPNVPELMILFTRGLGGPLVFGGGFTDMAGLDLLPGLAVFG
jgi:hypothetical protein